MILILLTMDLSMNMVKIDSEMGIKMDVAMMMVAVVVVVNYVLN